MGFFKRKMGIYSSEEESGTEEMSRNESIHKKIEINKKVEKKKNLNFNFEHKINLNQDEKSKYFKIYFFKFNCFY